MVGRIGKPHGIRGEVTVDVRTDEPDRRFAEGTVLRAQPPKGSAYRRTAADRARAPAGTGRCSRSPSTRSPTATRPRPLAASLLFADGPGRRDSRGPRRVLRPPARRPGGVRRRRHATWAGEVAGPWAEPRTCCGCAPPTAARRWCRSWPRWCPRSTSPADGSSSPTAPAWSAVRRGRGRRPMRLDYLTIFPDYLAPLQLSLPGKAVESGLLEVHVHDLRDWTHDRHRTVDDTPYGGGAGHGDEAGAVGRGVRRAGRSTARTIDLHHAVAVSGSTSARRRSCRPGRGWSSRAAATRASTSACSTTPRDRARSREISLGDYVLNGGEVAALAITEAVVRLLPGFMGNAESLVEESHRRSGLLEYPVYTKPPRLGGPRGPRRCCGRGDHGAIARWRHDQARGAVRRSAAPTCSHRRPSTTGRRSSAPYALTSRELLTLQRACWVQEALANPGVDIPRAARVARRRARLDDASGTPTSCAAPAGWSAAVRGRLDAPAARLGHRPDHGRPGPPGRGLGRVAARPHRGRRAGDRDVVRPLHRRRAASATSGCTRRPDSGCAADLTAPPARSC